MLRASRSFECSIVRCTVLSRSGAEIAEDFDRYRQGSEWKAEIIARVVVFAICLYNIVLHQALEKVSKKSRLSVHEMYVVGFIDKVPVLQVGFEAHGSTTRQVILPR